VLLNTLMTAAGWTETDSHEGSQCILQPAASTLYIGDDENVRDAAGVGVYKGFPVASGVSVNLAEYRTVGALVDPNATWIYCAAQDIAVIFQGL
jgi:hypothetical protein